MLFSCILLSYRRWYLRQTLSVVDVIVITFSADLKRPYLSSEQTHIQRVLSFCKYPAWAINRMELKTSTPRTTKSSKKDIKPISRSYITVPYNKGLSESFKNICQRYGIQIHFKSGNTIKDNLVAPKDKDHITKKVA